MMTGDGANSLCSRWLLPVAGPPIDGGYLTIHGERIVYVGALRPDGPIEDLGDVAILPGFVNVHTHLEFSELAHPLGTAGMPFTDWVRAVVAWRRSRTVPADSAISRGLAECLASGVTLVGEIAASRWAPAAPIAADVVVFRELLALNPARIQAQLELAQEHLGAARPDNETPGLSPHAPYSVHPQLLASAVEIAIRRATPLAMHLAESREELEFLATLGGPLRTMLEDFGAWFPGALRPGGKCLDYLRSLAAAPRALVIHGNYLSPEDEAFIAEQRHRLSVVYCPRTHAYFAHEPYPLALRLAAGVPMALGTDSRASNPDLSLWAECQFAAAGHPQVAPSTWLELATQAGARALGMERELGTLVPGKLANLAVVQWAEGSGGDPEERLLDPASSVGQTWIRGRRIYT